MNGRVAFTVQLNCCRSQYQGILQDVHDPGCTWYCTSKCSMTAAVVGFFERSADGLYHPLPLGRCASDALIYLPIVVLTFCLEINDEKRRASTDSGDCFCCFLVSMAITSKRGGNGELPCLTWLVVYQAILAILRRIITRPWSVTPSMQ
jgi:hypothetical protein